jgi:RNA polymerase sigma-70 factor (ECF subfamily)
MKARANNSAERERLNASFPTTQWSLVREASGGHGPANRAALARLLERYVPAMRVHLIRGRNLSPDDAEDLVQSFLADKVLGRDFIGLADESRGKFRTWLTMTLNRYVISQFRAARAQKRTPGGHVDFDEDLFVVERSPTPDRSFDVAWARQVLAQAIEAMRRECHAVGRLDVWGVFEARVLRPMLQQEEPVAYGELVARYGFTSPSQASNVLVTANRTFVRELRKVVGAYASSEQDIDEEIADLRRILAEPA